MDTKKRVLQVIPCLELGGTEAFVMNNYRQVDTEKMQFDFFVFSEKNYPYLEEINNRGGKVFYGTQPSLKNAVRFYKAFKKAVKVGGPYTAVHCHANISNALPILCAALCNIKIRIAHSHAVANKPKNIAKKLIFSIRKWAITTFSTKLLACSKEAGVSLFGSKSFSLKGSVCNNGIDVERFTKINEEKLSVLREEFAISKTDGPIFGNISRFDKNKNQSFIVEVFAELLKEYPNALLLLGGNDGGMLGQIKTKVKDLKIEERVRFIGKRSDVADCLQLIDVYIFPSLQEGLGIALLEAEAAGCLCFVSDTVPKESDMGLGTMSYCSLQNGCENWAKDIICKFENFQPPNADTIISCFKSNGYDIKNGGLMQYYGE